MAETLIIVESPAKARTIERFLGRGFVVASSIGHIRDLPSRTAEIPPTYRDRPWARTGVDIDNGFAPLYVVPAAKKEQVKKLKELAKRANTIYLATDEDREGEAIAWHLKETLQPKVPVKRMVFHEITKRAIEHALEQPRDLDRRLVDAQEARRILDRLYGYEVSPVLWRKVRPRLSAGRVQSVATRLVVEREQRRMAFRSAAFWSVGALLSSDRPGRVDRLAADLQEVAGRRLAASRHFDPATGCLTRAAAAENVVQLDQPAAQALRDALRTVPFAVIDVQKKPFTQSPHPPFITSTLQQEAARQLGFTAQRTMRVAQRLYERGYITYMRTDSTTLSDEATRAARQQVSQLYGQEYLPSSPRVYTKKVKGAQEAHEAIRPAGDAFRKPDTLQGELDAEEQRLYELIWKRAIASQMKDARGERTQARIQARVPESALPGEQRQLAGDALFSASGKVIAFPGYLRAYVEGADDPDAELEDKERLLPPLEVGDALSPLELEARQHQTQAPARYTEASLVKELEERGIGRPSTYATIIQTIQDRGYVWKQGSALVPTLTAFAVVSLLTRHFEELVDYEFTARMESDLDAISSGEKESTPWLERFYFGSNGRQEKSAERAVATREKRAAGKLANSGEVAKAKAVAEAGAGSARELNSPKRVSLAEHGLHGLIGSGVEVIDARDICSLEIGRAEDGSALTARVGRYGPYLQVGDTDRRVNIADDVLLDELDVAEAMRLIRQADLGNRVLGIDPATGKNVYLKTGSYGPYVQLGDPELTPKGNIKKGSRPKMASLWPSMSLETITLADALKLLSYPRSLGTHPETGAEITVQDGKFGPYVQMTGADGKRDSRSLEGHDQLERLDLAGAIALFAQPRQARRRQSNSVLASLGESPVTKQAIEARDGRFGPYVTDGQVNATIPRGRDPHKLTLADALELIAARELRMREQGLDPRAPKQPRTRKRRPSSATAATRARGKKSAARTRSGS